MLQRTFALCFLFATLLSHDAHAWGRRGHSIVCQTASYLTAQEAKADFLRSHSFDLGYYCNVPDLVWKKPATYEAEANNHFMDMEIFEREFKKTPELTKQDPFTLDRLLFNSTFPKVEDKAGRAWWRIREIDTEWQEITDKLKKAQGLAREEQHKLQADWLVRAGVIGHYVGDLGQPLHVTENYDGQLTEQKGVHSHFEDKIVDLVFLEKGRALENDVMTAARALWTKQARKMKDKELLAVLKDLTKESAKKLPELLKLDKKIGRENSSKAATAMRAMIVERLAASSVVMAELMRRRLDWQFNGQRFYSFMAEPAYIWAPGKSPQPAASPTPAK